MFLRLVHIGLHNLKMPTCCLKTPPIAYLAALRLHNDFAYLKSYRKLQYAFVGLDSVMKFAAPKANQETKAFTRVKIRRALDRKGRQLFVGILCRHNRNGPHRRPPTRTQIYDGTTLGLRLSLIARDRAREGGACDR